MILLCQKDPHVVLHLWQSCTRIHLWSALTNPEGNKGSNLHGEFTTKSQVNDKSTEVIFSFDVK